MTDTYPLDLGSHPQIGFKSRKPNTSSTNIDIALYAPQSLTVTDGMGYGNFDLGVITSTLQNSMVDGKISGEAFEANARSTLGATGESDPLTQSLFIKAVSNATGGGGLGAKVAEAGLRDAGVALNPNTVLQFTGPNVRSFGFEFRLVAQSETESRIIKKIIEDFRSAMYPSRRSNVVLQYPDIFSVTFNLGKEKHVPDYAESYLTSMSTTYNPSGNMYHRDGSPTDVSIQLSFTEFKALSREDIDSLKTGVPIKLGDDPIFAANEDRRDGGTG